MTQNDPLDQLDAKQRHEDAFPAPMTLDSLTAVLDWLTDEISALESNDLNTGGLLTLVWLKARRRELNVKLLAMSEDGEVLP